MYNDLFLRHKPTVVFARKDFLIPITCQPCSDKNSNSKRSKLLPAKTMSTAISMRNRILSYPYISLYMISFINKKICISKKTKAIHVKIVSWTQIIK
jgi:hypothetical protein